MKCEIMDYGLMERVDFDYKAFSFQKLITTKRSNLHRYQCKLIKILESSGTHQKQNTRIG